MSGGGFSHRYLQRYNKIDDLRRASATGKSFDPPFAPACSPLFRLPHTSRLTGGKCAGSQGEAKGKGLRAEPPGFARFLTPHTPFRSLSIVGNIQPLVQGKMEKEEDRALDRKVDVPVDQAPEELSLMLEPWMPPRCGCVLCKASRVCGRRGRRPSAGQQSCYGVLSRGRKFSLYSSASLLPLISAAETVRT